MIKTSPVLHGEKIKARRSLANNLPEQGHTACREKRDSSAYLSGGVCLYFFAGLYNKLVRNVRTVSVLNFASISVVKYGVFIIIIFLSIPLCHESKW